MALPCHLREITLWVKKKLKDNINYKIIDTRSGLEDFVKILEMEKVIAVDLESDSMYHFKEKVCLIQVATNSNNVLIDPLQIEDLSSIRPLFSNQKIKKIFHGSDYDIRSLYRDFRINVNNLFDTELACRFLGIRETGLDAVLKKYFKINLNKKYQKKDWSIRPLPSEMTDYAAGDVIYLLSLVEILEKELDKKERLSWVHEECDLLSKVRPVVSNEDPLFLKFKGAGKLTSRDLAVLEALLQFRKKVAEKKDKPLFKIIGSKPLMKIIISKPVTMRRLKDERILSETQISMYGNALVEIINAAVKIPEKDLPVYPYKKVPLITYRVKERIKALKAWRDKRARELEIDPALLFNKELLKSIAKQKPSDKKSLETIEGMKKWQKKEFGGEVIATLGDVL